MAPDSIWEIVFLMVILKIPIAFLCGVVWYAIKAEPRPEEGAGVTVETGPDGPPPRRWRRRLTPRRLGPASHGGPVRRPPRAPRTAFARAGRRRERS